MGVALTVSRLPYLSVEKVLKSGWVCHIMPVA